MFTFLLAGAICLAGALGVVLFRNPVHTALSLVATLFGVAVLFIAQEAYFLAAIQVIVYAGAIVVLFLFVIMLLGVDRVESIEQEPLVGQRPVAAVLGIADPRSDVDRPALDRRRGHRRHVGAGAARPGDPRHRTPRPSAVHRLRLRLRDHRRPAHHRRRRCRRARPTAGAAIDLDEFPDGTAEDVRDARHAARVAAAEAAVVSGDASTDAAPEADAEGSEG